MKTILYTVLFIAFVASSCGSGNVFKEYKKMDNMTWNRFDVPIFEVPVEEGDMLDFFLELRHHTGFPYDKLYVNITFYSPDGDMRSFDYDFNLKDKDGNWLAKGMGDLWDIELPIRRNLLFNKTGICRVRVENKYPKYDTPGIMEVGLLVKRSQEE